jgi:hypothetical protein
LPPQLKPSRKPQRAVVDVIVHAPATGRLVALPFAEVTTDERTRIELDVDAQIGADVSGPEEVFATVLAELSVIGKDLRHARALAAEVLRDPPLVGVTNTSE